MTRTPLWMWALWFGVFVGLGYLYVQISEVML